MAHRQGMTLIEMMVALVIFTLVLATALGALRSQTRGFDRGSDEMSVLQNMRFAADLMEQEIRAAGNNLAPSQPPVVYADTNAFAFNADLISNTPGDLFAVYVDPDAPAAEVTGFALGAAQNIPQSSFSYPVVDYFGNVAETIIFYFEPDSSTADGADFRLMRQVNDQPEEVVIRNVLPHPDRPFFQYFHENEITRRIDSVPTDWYPLSHSAAAYTGDQSVQINQLRAVEVNYTVSNGRTGADQRTQQMTFVVSMPNTGIAPPPNCGAAPELGITMSADTAGYLGAERIDLTWLAADDDIGGARDIERYVIWRRQGASGPWGTPYRSIPAGRSSYTFSDDNVTVGQTYYYLMAAQDCTPLMSLTVAASRTSLAGPPQP